MHLSLTSKSSFDNMLSFYRFTMFLQHQTEDAVNKSGTHSGKNSYQG